MPYTLAVSQREYVHPALVSSLYQTWHVPQASAIPGVRREFALVGPVGRGWALVKPLLVSVEQEEDGWFVLSDGLFPVYGDGATLEAARTDYVAALIDYHELLAAHAPEDAHDARELEHLRLYLRRELSAE